MAAVLWIHHLAQLEETRGTNPWVVNQRDSDHPNGRVYVPRLLGEELPGHDLDARAPVRGHRECDVVARYPDP